MNVSASDFLQELWGSPPPGSVLIWRLQDRHSRWLRSLKTEPVTLGEPDVYTGVGLAHKSYGKYRRCPRNMIVAIPGLWADIDVDIPAGMAKRTGAHPTWDDAVDTAYALAEPTILVKSGYGFQAWWLFEGGPWRFRTYGEQQLAVTASAQWQALLRSKTPYALDYTHDLARLLRLPHTDNCKVPHRHRMCEVMELGPRHERDELIEIARQAGEIDPGYQIVGEHKPTVLREPESYDIRVAEHLIAYSSMFARTWRHERPELPSMSEHDLSLGSIAALAGGTDQQIADVITAHRAQHGDVKGQRPDYLRRTISKIRGSQATV